MGLNVGDVTAYIKADVSGFNKGIDDARSGTSRLKGTMDGLVSGSQAFIRGLTIAGAAIGGAGLFAIKSAGDMEMLRSSMDVLTGSTASGSKMFKDLYDFAAKTPFETGDLAKGAQTMLSFGVANEKVIPNLKMLGDISMGNKDKLGSLTLAFSQITSTGRLMGQDLLQLINGGFNPLTIISQKTGKSMSVLKDEMEKGKISADMVRDAMVTATSAGGLFYQGMDKGANTLQGVWSTLQDTAGMTIRKLVGLSETGDIIKGGLFEKVKSGVNELITFLNNNQQKIIDFVKNSFGWLKDNLPIVIGLIVGGVVPAIYATTVAMLKNPITWFALAFAGLGFVLNEVAKSVGGWNNLLNIGKGYLIELWKILEPVVMPVLRVLKALWDDLIAVLTDFWNKNKDWLIPTLKFVAIVLGVIIVGSIMATVAAIMIIIGVIDILVRAFGWVADQVRKQVDIMRQNWEMFKVGIETIANAITNAFKASFNAVARFWNETVGKIDFTIPKWLPGGGSRIAVPKIPMLAQGTDNFQGGQAWVGEKGPELVTLPKGSKVTPNGKAGGDTFNIHFDGVMARSRSDLREIAKDLVESINEERRATGGAVI